MHQLLLQVRFYSLKKILFQFKLVPPNLLLMNYKNLTLHLLHQYSLFISYMKGQMMHFPLSTHTIIEFGNRVFPHKEIISIMPNGTRHQYNFHELYTHSKKQAHALVHQLTSFTAIIYLLYVLNQIV